MGRVSSVEERSSLAGGPPGAWRKGREDCALMPESGVAQGRDCGPPTAVSREEKMLLEKGTDQCRKESLQLMQHSLRWFGLSTYREEGEIISPATVPATKSSNGLTVGDAALC